MKTSSFTIAALLSVILGLGLALRLFIQQNGFRQIVNESLVTSEGYDQKFIDLVNHLEDVLTTRASFSFMGGKDPMTGRRREVANLVSNQQVVRRAAPVKVAFGKSKKGQPAPPPQPEAPPPAPSEDHVKLTAIIADDYGQHTAIVMNGERSMSVDVGDNVGNRKVTHITAKEIIMEDDSTVFTYGIAGNRTQQPK